jgi:hypothetical protein
MKKLPILLSALLAAAAFSPVWADDFGVAPASQVGSPGLTRAEVKAETLRALKAHEIQFGDVYDPIAPSSEPSRPRAEVKAETMQALANHEVTFGDVSPPPVIAYTSTKTRAEVKAETLQAARNHELQFGDIYEPWKVAEARQAEQQRLAMAAAKRAASDSSTR